jgi:hypothetical protein
MAKKISKSIVRGLDRLRKVLGGAPEKSPASKKTAKRAERRPAPSPAPPPADQAVSQGNSPEAPEAKPDKKKVVAQPWFRHRQRW